jgi:uncharacterized protein (TIGR00266 family)
MNIEILSKGAFESALVHLERGEQFVSDAGAMYRASANVDVDVTTRSRGSGGLMAGVKRLLSADTFFLSTYQTTDGQPGEVGVAPTHQGEVFVIDVEPSTPWICAGGSYLGSSAGLKVDTQFQGMKGLFTGESMFFVEVSGSGQLLVSAFGRIVESAVEDALTVDTGHLVAFEKPLQYSMTKAGSSWMQSWLACEGIVMNFTGRGSILTQSHNPKEFGKRLGPLLPPRQ